MSDVHHFPFGFDPLFAVPARLLGIRSTTAWVDVDEERISARFGPWRVETTRANVAEAAITGPYSIPKTIGPAHLSLRDGGLTFATNQRAGVCISFKDPVRGIDPLGLVRHRGLTVTVEDPGALAALLDPIGLERRDRGAELEAQEVIDELHSMTASEVRSYARSHGIEHAGSSSKAELIGEIEHDPEIDLERELRG